MTTYAYDARDEKGQLVSGQLVAASIEEVARQIRSQGRYVVSIDVAASSMKRQSRGIKVARADVLQISNQLSVMLDTGVTLADALECCAQNCPRPPVRALLEDLSQQVRNGGDFSGALARHPRSFPAIYVALIKASEKNGMMSRLIARATGYLRDEQEITRRVKGALTYPAIMFGFAMLTTLSLLIFVLPRFTVIYANRGAALPVPTQILMTMSQTLTTHWMYIVPSVLVAIAGAWAFGRTDRGAKLFDWLVLRIPLIGPMLQTLYLTRGLRTIGTMAGSGVNIVECVETATSITRNREFRAMWNLTLDQIQIGRPFSDSLGQSPLVPNAVTRMLSAGEKSGKLAMVMEQVASFGETELKERITEMTRYIEPAMLLIMGTVIGGITLALLLPIFQISKVVAN
jgi:type IV pilus assembly protein PilC